MTEPDVCECGVPLDIHPPLPKPKPLRSWMAERGSRPPTSAKGKPIVLRPRSERRPYP